MRYFTIKSGKITTTFYKAYLSLHPVLVKTSKNIMERRTVKHHVSQKGLYVYARKQDEKTELIILYGTNNEQKLSAKYCEDLITMPLQVNNSLVVKNDLTKDIKLEAHQSLIIEL